MKPWERRCLWSLCAGLALSGCANRVEVVSPIATADHPRVVELMVVGMIQPGTRFITDGTSAVREEYSLQAYHDGQLNGLPATQQRVTPTPARRAAFWRVVNRLDLAAWKPEYDQSDIPADRNGNHWYVTDSLQWTMRLNTPGRTQTSKGDGASPVIGHPSRAMSDAGPAPRNGVQILENAFEELLRP